MEENDKSPHQGWRKVLVQDFLREKKITDLRSLLVTSAHQIAKKGTELQF